MPGCTAAVVWPTSLVNFHTNFWPNLETELLAHSVLEVSPIKCDVRECVVRTSDSLENHYFETKSYALWKHDFKILDTAQVKIRVSIQ